VNSRLLDPRLNLIDRLEASVGDPQDLGEISAGHRRIVPLIGDLQRLQLGSDGWPSGTSWGGLRRLRQSTNTHWLPLSASRLLSVCPGVADEARDQARNLVDELNEARRRLLGP